MSIEKFDPAELEANGTYDFYGTAFGYPAPMVERLNTPITPRENWERFLYDGEGYAWIPNITTDCNNFFSETIPDCIAQEFAGGTDAFGCEWIPVEGGLLPSFVKPGNPVLKDIEDWENFPWPDADSWDWEKMRETYKPYMYPERWTLGYLPGVYFERLIHLLDSENALCALMEDKECVHGIFNKLTEHHLKVLENWKKYLDIDIVWIGDDWGTQRAPFFSREVFWEFIAPYYQKILKRCEELHVYPLTHTCGRTACYMEDYVKMGVKTWECQTDCNPDIFERHKQFGKDLKLEVYTVIGDFEGTMTVEEFYKDTAEKAKKYLMDKNVFIMANAYDDLWREKQRVLYEISRKIVTGEEF